MNPTEKATYRQASQVASFYPYVKDRYFFVVVFFVVVLAVVVATAGL